MTHYRHYKHLHVPDQWEQYWSKYPNGYSIMESLIDWVSQTNKMIESFNDLSDEYTTLNRNMRALEVELRASWKGYKEHTEKTYSDFRDEILTIINQWIATIEPTIQDEVVKSLTDWLSDGTLAEIINEDVFNMKADNTRVDNLEEEVSTKVDNELFNNELNKKSDYSEMVSRLDANFIDVTREPWNVPNNGTDDATAAIQNVLDNAPIRHKVFFPAGRYKVTNPLNMSRELTIEGAGGGENGVSLLDYDIANTSGEVIGFRIRNTAKNSKIGNLYFRNKNKDVELQGIGNVSGEPAITHLDVYNVWVVGFTTGFLFRNIYLSRFYQCYAVDGYTGFNFLGESTSLIFHGCYANKNNDNWRLRGLRYCSLISCSSDGAERYGYYIASSDGVSLRSCGVENAKGTGVYITSSNGITIDSLFGHRNGSNTNTSLGNFIQVEASNHGVVLNGVVENSIGTTSERQYSVIIGNSNDCVLNGCKIIGGLYTTATTVLNGQRRSASRPTTGTFKRGEFVYSSANNTTMGWYCTEGGSPGEWQTVAL